MNTKIKSVIFSIILLAIISSCSRSIENVFDQSATVRVQKVMTDCQQALLSSKDGWRLDYTTPDGYKATFVMQFLGHDSVATFADFSNQTTVSSYSFNYGQGPVLSFDTYGQLHLLADPEVAPIGVGHGGDYEFVIIAVSSDSIVLNGRKNRDRIVLRKAIPGLVNSFLAAANKDRFLKLMDVDLGAPISFFHGITVGTSKADLMLSDSKDKLNVTTADGMTASDINFNAQGFDLVSPVSVGGVSISKFVWDESVKKFVANASVSIDDATSPTYSKGATASMVIGGYYDVVNYSAPLVAWYTALGTAFPVYQRSEIYLSAPTKMETISLKTVAGVTSEVKRDTTSTTLTSYSFIFNNASNKAVWNNFKGTMKANPREDQIALTIGIRDGENATALNNNTTVRKIPTFFYNSSGFNVYIRGSKIYMVSISDSKSWFELKKGTKEIPIQTIYKNI